MSTRLSNHAALELYSRLDPSALTQEHTARRALLHPGGGAQRWRGTRSKAVIRRPVSGRRRGKSKIGPSNP